MCNPASPTNVMRTALLNVIGTDEPISTTVCAVDTVPGGAGSTRDDELWTVGSCNRPFQDEPLIVVLSGIATMTSVLESPFVSLYIVISLDIQAAPPVVIRV